MRVRHADDLQHALQRAVLARVAVQHVERDIGLQCLQHGRDVAPDVDLGDAVALGLERLGASLAGAQADLALGRPAAHQDRDVFGGMRPQSSRSPEALELTLWKIRFAAATSQCQSA